MPIAEKQGSSSEIDTELSTVAEWMDGGKLGNEVLKVPSLSDSTATKCVQKLT